MKLPVGVTYHARQAALIAKDRNAIIRIETAGFPANAAYKINDRRHPQAVAPFIRGDWEEFNRSFRLSPQRRVRFSGVWQPNDVLYSGAEHRGDSKLPNITVVPNWLANEHLGNDRLFKVFGCTMGHYHPKGAAARTQEIYEFQSYGLFVLDREAGEVEIWVAKDTDKVAVPDGCHMTLYNLGDEDNPLVTLDFADPDRNDSNKDLIERCGPVLLAYYNDFEVIFRLNRAYINNAGHAAGVQLNGWSSEDVPEVRIALGARLELGRLLYEELTQNQDVVGRFARLGLRIRQASPDTVLEPPSLGAHAHVYFSLPLADATPVGTGLYRYFLNGKHQKAGEPRGKGLAATEADLSEDKKRYFQLAKFERPLRVLVEGAGDWVEKAYRPLFKKKVAPLANVFNLAVIYADDSRWKRRPPWATPEHPKYDLQPWETYLDKADALSYAKYEALLPDVVFVITPDFTHASIAARWLGRSQLVFVEKPFDSQLSNVAELLRQLGRRHGASVLGLDHYQLNSIQIHEMMPAIEKHLGGAIAEVVFYMTEATPVELERVKTLQYGLTLDFLPHCFALLDYFGDLGSIDEIRVLDAGQYDPLDAIEAKTGRSEDISERFRSETYSRLTFSFQDYSANGFHIPCSAVVGKGFSQAVKYLELTGRNGDTIRVDLTRQPHPDPAPGYPWLSLLFLQSRMVTPEANVPSIRDPYDARRTLQIVAHRQLEQTRYEKLIDDLLRGKNQAAASTMMMDTAWKLVHCLDRAWRAIQDARPRWNEVQLGQVDPIRLNDRWAGGTSPGL